MASTNKEKLDTPYKDAIFKNGGGIGSPAPQSTNKGKGK